MSETSDLCRGDPYSNNLGQECDFKYVQLTYQDTGGWACAWCGKGRPKLAAEEPATS